MLDFATLTDDAVVAELGSRLERHRIARNLTQQQLADQAGVSRPTVQRLESGQSVQLTSLVRVLRRLELLGALDSLIPQAVDRPVEQLARERRTQRQRVRHPATPGGDAGGDEWRWGDER